MLFFPKPQTQDEPLRIRNWSELQAALPVSLEKLEFFGDGVCDGTNFTEAAKSISLSLGVCFQSSTYQYTPFRTRGVKKVVTNSFQVGKAWYSLFFLSCNGEGSFVELLGFQYQSWLHRIDPKLLFSHYELYHTVIDE